LIATVSEGEEDTQDSNDSKPCRCEQKEPFERTGTSLLGSGSPLWRTVRAVRPPCPVGRLIGSSSFRTQSRSLFFVNLGRHSKPVRCPISASPFAFMQVKRHGGAGKGKENYYWREEKPQIIMHLLNLFHCVSFKLLLRPVHVLTAKPRSRMSAFVSTLRPRKLAKARSGGTELPITKMVFRKRSQAARS
jgi:hypothetical protein